MSKCYFIYTKENVAKDDVQKIVDAFPQSWVDTFFSTRQTWGWAAMASIHNPWHDYDDEDYGLGKVGVVVIGESIGGINYLKRIDKFVVKKLREQGYTVLKNKYS